MACLVDGTHASHAQLTYELVLAVDYGKLRRGLQDSTITPFPGAALALQTKGGTESYSGS
jgi:hypothetical protein